MEDVNDLLYDENDERMNEVINKKEKRKRKRKQHVIFLILGLIVLFAGYLISDYSKIKSLSVTGNNMYTEKEIYEITGIDYNNRYLFTSSFIIKSKLKRCEFIEDAKIVKENGTIEIQLKEKKVVGYLEYEDGSRDLLLANGEKINCTKDGKLWYIYDSCITKVPLITGFDDEEQLQNLAKGFFNTKKEVTQQFISRISEITPFVQSYDEHMVKLLMQDGNSVYSSYDGIGLLCYYDDVLKELQGTDVCLFVEETANIMMKAECPK